jgi:uncharacterized protein YukE
MSDLVHANPRDVRRLANDLRQYEEKIKQLSKDTQRAIDRANWKDNQKQMFQASFNEFGRSTSRFIEQKVQTYVKSLNSLADDLERAQSRRF